MVCLISGFLTTVVFAVWKEKPCLKLLDVYFLSFLLSSAVGRIGTTFPFSSIKLTLDTQGCYLQGCCRGKIITWPISWQGKRHPTQLYSAMVNFSSWALLHFLITYDWHCYRPTGR